MLNDESRYAVLAQSAPGGKVTREYVLESLQVRLSREMGKRLFDALNGGAEARDPVDLATFVKVVHALERAGRGERRRLVFCVFDPAGNGRIRGAEFRKTMVEMLRGFDATAASGLSALAPDSPELKVLSQTLTDAAFAIYCHDYKHGLTYDEWFAFASDDPETCRLLGVLDRRNRNRVVELRKLMPVAGAGSAS